MNNEETFKFKNRAKDAARMTEPADIATHNDPNEVLKHLEQEKKQLSEGRKKEAKIFRIVSFCIILLFSLAVCFL